MRALRLVADRKLEIAEVDPPPPPGEGEVQIKTQAIALNHIDVWGWRGMAFAKRKLPLVVGAEASGEIAAVGPGVKGFAAGDAVTPYGALTCGQCKACREGRDNLCEVVNGVTGFHVDGFARDFYNYPARLVVRAPKGISPVDAACAPLTFATVVHMLFDNAKLTAGETVLVHAGGFRARHQRQLALGEGHAAPAPDVDVVEPDRLDADLHLARGRCRGRVDVEQLELAVGDQRKRAHRAARRLAFADDGCGSAGHAGSRVMTRQTFWPPNPNELERANLTSAVRASFGT